MVEVKIKNFQSLEDIDLKVDGFTTIIGKNYLGKSAILRAINAALTNQQGTDFIRWGEKFCEVYIKTSAIEILWHKEDGNNFYVIDGKDRYDKIGKDAPPKKILDAGFNLLKIGDQKVNLNYAQQFFPLFLVDRQDSKGVDILASVYGLDRIYKAMDICNKQQRENADILKIREKDIDLVEKDIEKFKNWDSVEAFVKEIKKGKEKLDKNTQRLQQLKVWEEKLNALVIICKKLQTATKIKKPAPGDLDKSISELKRLRTYYDSYVITEAAVQRLKKVEEVHVSKEDHSKTVKNIDVLRNYYQKLVSITSEYDKLKSVEKIKKPEIVIDTSIVEKLRGYYKILLQGKQDLSSLKEDIDKLTGEKSIVEGELSKFDVCPLCGAQRKGN